MTEKSLSYKGWDDQREVKKMAVFRWQGISPRGDTISGEMEATTRDAVVARLRAQRIQPIPAKIRERGKGLDKDISIPGLGEKIKTRDVVVFTRQLGTMIDAGLPIVQCLDILAQQTDNKKFRGVIRQLKEDVEAGSTFTEALRKHKIFDDLFVNMISAGEVGGILDTILQRLSIYMEKSMKLKAKIKGAMIYPATIITVATGVTTVLLIWVIPVFAELFSSFGQALPVDPNLDRQRPCIHRRPHHAIDVGHFDLVVLGRAALLRVVVGQPVARCLRSRKWG